MPFTTRFLGSFIVLFLLNMPIAHAGGIQTLETVDVTDTSETSLVGSADTASEGTIIKEQIDERPVYREGELLEAVPGILVTQHSGEGKANQYYLRGFNLDHGTDIAITVDDTPVNLPSHAHGQGYSDLSFMIPELMNDIKYEKGTYAADQGDFATAGAVQIDYVDKLDKNIAEVGSGTFGYDRGMTAISHPFGAGNIVSAIEYQHLDGPFDKADDYQKGNAVLRYSEGSAANGWALTGMAYAGKWDATNQIPGRAVDDGQLPYFGTENPTDGGNAQRFSIASHMARTDANGRLKASVYAVQSELDLYNDFTFFLFNPVQGDQFHQHDDRLYEGGEVSYAMPGKLLSLDTENTIGLNARNDNVGLGLYQTQDRQYLSTDRVDQVTERNGGLFAENRTQWLEKVRTVIGIREDAFYGDDRADNPLNSGSVSAYKTSPKGNIIFGPWSDTEFYVSVGKGFHSNDVRSTTSAVEPTDFNNNVQGISGSSTQKFPLLEAAFGDEVGVRTSVIPGLETSLALFQLKLASEQVFSGDAGDSSPSGSSTRQGFEFANFYKIARGITANGDLSMSKARFDEPVSDGITTGRYIAGSPATVFSTGLTFEDFGKWSGGIQDEFYGPRPLTDDNSVRSPSTNILNVRVGYKILEGLKARLDINNLLNQKQQDVSYYYASRLQNEPLSTVGSGTDDVHFHATEPLGIRISLVANF